MDILQNYFQTVLSRAEDIKTATLLMKGYQDGRNVAEDSPFEPRAAKPPAPLSRPTAAEMPSDGQISKFDKTRGSYVLPDNKASKWSVLLLTEKEVLRMPKQFRKQFRVGKLVAHVRQKPNGVYEIRCQINKKQIAVSSKLLETAKEKFIAALKNFEDNSNVVKPVPEPVIEPVKPEIPSVTLSEYMLKWLETVKKPTIKENSYSQYLLYYKNIISVLGDKPLTKLKPFEVQEFINGIVNEGKNTTAKQCRTMLNAVFEYAVVDDMIKKSPMAKISVPHIEPKEGVPFTRTEEKELVSLMLKDKNIYIQAYVFMLYTGLRRSELASIIINNGWINVISAKRQKGYKQKTRSIPISPMLAPLLPFIDIERIKKLKTNTISTYAVNLIPNHHVHELRHTFITRCQECGIRREIVSLWAGHAADNSITTTIYTHLQTNKELQINEMQKFKYDL